MTDTQLRNEILNQIQMSIANGNLPGPQSAAVLTAIIDQGIANYRAATGATPSSAYATALGSFILSENPYAAVDDLVKPNIPTSSTAENPWVRRGGVLAQFNAGNPLPGSEPIPAGHVVHFSWVDWGHLQPNFSNLGTAPPSDVARPASQVLPANDTKSYGHNIVKTIRLQYTVKDRRYVGDAIATASGVGSTQDLQAGFILIQYSGSDH